MFRQKVNSSLSSSSSSDDQLRSAADRVQYEFELAEGFYKASVAWHLEFNKTCLRKIAGLYVSEPKVRKQAKSLYALLKKVSDMVAAKKLDKSVLIQLSEKIAFKLNEYKQLTTKSDSVVSELQQMHTGFSLEINVEQSPRPKC